jgi:hypothetical protein
VYQFEKCRNRCSLKRLLHSLRYNASNSRDIAVNTQTMICTNTVRCMYCLKITSPTAEGSPVSRRIPSEFFRSHSNPILLMGFIGNYKEMVTVDAAGKTVLWIYNRLAVKMLLTIVNSQLLAWFLAEMPFALVQYSMDRQNHGHV